MTIGDDDWRLLPPLPEELVEAGVLVREYRGAAGDVQVVYAGEWGGVF